MSPGETTIRHTLKRVMYGFDLHAYGDGLRAEGPVPGEGRVPEVQPDDIDREVPMPEMTGEAGAANPFID